MSFQPITNYFRPAYEGRAAIGWGIAALYTFVLLLAVRVGAAPILGDVQLFSQLKALNEIKAALQAINSRPAQEAIGRVDQLLGHVFHSGRSIFVAPEASAAARVRINTSAWSENPLPWVKRPCP